MPIHAEHDTVKANPSVTLWYCIITNVTTLSTIWYGHDYRQTDTVVMPVSDAVKSGDICYDTIPECDRRICLNSIVLCMNRHVDAR